MLTIEVKVTDGDEKSTYACDLPDHSGIREGLGILATSISVDGSKPSLARVAALLLLPGLNVALKTYADKRHKQRIAELRDYF